MAEFNSKSDLILNARRHLLFLEKVNKHQNLYEGHLVAEALYRYEKFWLELASKHQGELLIPPLDIQWVWHVHMLAPKTYETDCKAVVGKIVDSRFPQNSKEAASASKLTKHYWASSWPGEKFDIELDKDWTQVIPRTCVTKIAYDLKSAISKQKLFYYHVSLPHYRDKNFLDEGLARYKRFLFLKQMNPDEFLVPCHDMNLIWHTHQAEPVIYAEETKEFLGRLLNHDDKVNNKMVESHQYTKKMWLETFSESLSKEGCMSRGNVPGSNLSHSATTFSDVSSSPFNNTANKYSISLMKMELNNCHAKSCTLAVYKRYTDKEDKKIIQRSGPNMSWSGRPPTGIKNFRFDSSKCTHLSLVLTKTQGVCCFKESEVLGRHHLPQMNDSETDYSSSQELNYNLQLLEGDTPTAVTVQLKMTRFPLTRGPLVLRVRPEPFSTLTDPPPDIWGPVPLPLTNPARPLLPKDVHIATHSLLTHHNKIAYKVQLLHGIMEGMSAILVRNENDMQVISEAHLIGPDQLPLYDQLAKPARCVCLSDQRTERAILIRDAKGDWGICVGRWAAYRKNTTHQPTLEKKVDKKNPGFLHLRFYDLRKGKMARMYLPSREKKSMSFRFDFNLGDVYVDMEEGHLIVSKNSVDHAQNVALGFAVCVLFSLCQPYPPSGSGHQVTVNQISHSLNPDQPPSNEMPMQELPIENYNLPSPRYKPSDERTPRKKLYSNDDLVFLSAVGYWYYSGYPVYYETEVCSDFACDNSLVWDEDNSEADFSKGIDDTNSNRDGDLGAFYDNETMTMEEGEVVEGDDI